MDTYCQVRTEENLGYPIQEEKNPFMSNLGEKNLTCIIEKNLAGQI